MSENSYDVPTYDAQAIARALQESRAEVARLRVEVAAMTACFDDMTDLEAAASAEVEELRAEPYEARIP